MKKTILLCLLTLSTLSACGGKLDAIRPVGPDEFLVATYHMGSLFMSQRSALNEAVLYCQNKTMKVIHGEVLDNVYSLRFKCLSN